MMDLPLWRVDVDASGREVRLVELPYEKSSYDMTTFAVLKRIQDRNQDGVWDRFITYEGRGGARLEETDTDFDGVIDRWDTFGFEGQRLRSATARYGDKPDRIATYDSSGSLAKVETDMDHDGHPELIQIFEHGRFVENRMDSDHDGRIDRIQDFRPGYLASETVDADQDGTADVKLIYNRQGLLVKVETQASANPKKTRP